MGFFGCIPRFLKAHAGWVLNGIGTVGFGATVILAAKEAPEAKEAIEDAQLERFEARAADKAPEDVHDMIELSDEAFLNRWERFKIAVPYYIPAILTGLGTLACFWGGQVFNARKQTALIAAYGLLATEYDQYRQVIRETQGEETDKQAYILAHKKVRELEAEIKRLKEENGPFLYAIDTIPDVVFEAKPADIHEALMHFNRNLILRGENSLSELYRFIGLPDAFVHDKTAENFGWNEYENEITFEAGYADFSIVPVTTNSGEEIRLIHCFIPPYDLNASYGEVDSPDFTGIILPGYDPAYLIETLKRFPAEKVKVDHPALYAPHW